MNSFRFFPICAAILILFGCPVFGQADSPNVIVIMTDDQGYGDFGFMGNKQIETPSLDALASESLMFQHFYVSPVCSPTRACLMTGRYNYRTRVVDTFAGRSMMDPDEKTMAEYFKDLNYRTGIFGKWHLGDCYPMRPMDQGFDVSVVHRGGGIGQSSDPPNAEGKYSNPVLQVNGKSTQFNGYCTDIYFDQANRFIQESVAKEVPFFVYLADNCPHGPFRDVPEIWRKKYESKGDLEDVPKNQQDKTKRVYAMISNIDENIGRLRRLLENQGIADNTIFIFLTDNGPNGKRYTAGLRNQKTSVYEGGIRTPLLFHWPKKKLSAAKVQSVHAHIDILPTLLECCSAEYKPNRKFDGRSFAKALSDPNHQFESRTLFIQTHRGNTPQKFHHFAAIKNRWKLVHPSGFGNMQINGTPQFELYNLEKDPGENNNLSAEEPEIVAQLKSEYEAWFHSVSSERTDNYDIPRIVIRPNSTSNMEPIALTRQDLRTPNGTKPFSPDSGWFVSISESLTCDIELRFKGKPIGQQAQLKIGHRSFTVPFDSKNNRAKFESLTLSPGEAEISAFVNQPSGKKILVHQIEISPKSPR